MHGTSLFSGVLQLTGLDGFAQRKSIAGRLGEIDKQRIDLLHHGQGGGFPLPDQRPFRDQCPANAAGNRGRHLGVTQVDLRRAHTGLRGFDLGLGL